MPQLFWDSDPSDSKSSIFGNKAATKAQAREPLELPPPLRADIELPAAHQVGTNSNEQLPERYRKAVAGKAVALDARVYDVAADQVFSAAVDAMTSLNMPIESVDSPSGIVTTDWIRKGANNNSMLSGLMGKSGNITRHRFVVRVFRVNSEQQPKSRLEVRTLLQKFIGRHWVNTTMHQRHAEAFFSTVEEQMGRITGDATAP